MNPPRKPIVSAHRLARLVAWAGAVLAWFALGAPAVTRNGQRRKRRFAHFSIRTLTHVVRGIIILRAIQLLDTGGAPSRRVTQRPRPVPIGARLVLRRMTPRVFAGAWLRRQLKRRAPFALQVAHLIDALAHRCSLAACLAWRPRLTREQNIIPTAPVPMRLFSLAAPQPCAVDSS